MASDGRGTVYITDRRIIFVGAIKTVVTPFAKIVDMAPLEDGFHLDVQNGSPFSYATGNQLAFLTYTRIRDKAFPALSQEGLDNFDKAAQPQ